MKQTPFRTWFRDSTPTSRRRAAISAVALTASLTWIVVPTADPSAGTPGQRVAAASGVAAGAPSAIGASTDPAATGTTGVGGTPGALGVPDGQPASSAIGGPEDPRCAGLTASDQGVRADTIVIGVGIIDLAGPVGNSAFDLRPDQEEIVRAVVDDINERGGVDCRRLEAKTYKVNLLDENDQRAKCLQATRDDKVFAFLDAGGFAVDVTQRCFTVEHHVPLVTSVGWTPGYYRDQAPFLSSYNAGTAAEARNWVFNAADNGFFDRAKGFVKLGLLDDLCFPEIVEEVKAALAAIGLTSSDIVEETLSCETGLIASPGLVAQAAFDHKIAKVSHVFPATFSPNIQAYLTAAKSQDFHPVFGASDLYCLTCPGLTNGFDADEWDGTVAYTASRSGDLHAGLPLSDESANCNAVLEAHGVRGVREETDDVARVYCDLFHFFTATMRTVPVNPTRLDFATAVPSIGNLATAGVSDGLFNRPDIFTGADFWRPITWFRDCSCWKVTDPEFRPAR